MKSDLQTDACPSLITVRVLHRPVWWSSLSLRSPVCNVTLPSCSPERVQNTALPVAHGPIAPTLLSSWWGPTEQRVTPYKKRFMVKQFTRKFTSNSEQYFKVTIYSSKAALLQKLLIHEEDFYFSEYRSWTFLRASWVCRFFSSISSFSSFTWVL